MRHRQVVSMKDEELCVARVAEPLGDRLRLGASVPRGNKREK